MGDRFCFRKKNRVKRYCKYIIYIMYLHESMKIGIRACPSMNRGDNANVLAKRWYNKTIFSRSDISREGILVRPRQIRTNDYRWWSEHSSTVINISTRSSEVFCAKSSVFFFFSSFNRSLPDPFCFVFLFYIRGFFLFYFFIRPPVIGPARIKHDTYTVYYNIKTIAKKWSRLFSDLYYYIQYVFILRYFYF